MSDKAKGSSAGQELLFEIGCEEIPAGYIDPALAFLEVALPQALADARIGHGSVRVDGTPRRLVIIVDGIAPQQRDLEEELTGPAWSVAFTTGADGQPMPTPAGEGFLRKNGLSVSDVVMKESKKGPVVFATRRQAGRSTAEVLPGILEGLLPKLPFKKQMRWGDGKSTFARPVQWLLALLDGRPLPVRFADVVSGDTTRGHRYHAPAAVKVRSTDEYLATLARGHVVLAREERRRLIIRDAERLAESQGGKLLRDDALVEIVKNLVEKPHPVLGHFEDRFLAVPKELLISEMREHQKYFAVVDDSGGLLPCFVVVAGSQSDDQKGLAAGNARVLRARFEDGAFYYHEDARFSLAQRAGALAGLVFHRELGSMADKATRIVENAVALARAVGLDDASREATRKAGALCKADLVAGVVNEFPELQGVMGRYYALNDGESPDVAWGIEDHYAPRHAGAPLPRGHVGAVVGIADRIDTVVGLLGIGKAPSGSADPFALRRAAIAIVHVVMSQGYRSSLADFVEVAIGAYKSQGRLLKVDTGVLKAQVLEFLRTRVRGVLIERCESDGLLGAEDIVDAAMGARGGVDDLPDVLARTLALARMRNMDAPAFLSLAATFKRVGNIVKKAREDGVSIDNEPTSTKLLEDVERGLLSAVATPQSDAGSADLSGRYQRRLVSIAELKPKVDAFFDQVMVMTQDVEVRAARLGLLARIEAQLVDVADFTRVQGT